jgi:TusA-related sulfurtransferase
MSETQIEPDVTVDSRGATCPGPLMDLIGKVKESDPGTVIELRTSDGGSKNDVPDWIDTAGHELLCIEPNDDESEWTIYVEVT